MKLRMLAALLVLASLAAGGAGRVAAAEPPQAHPGLPPGMLPFGDANDPNRPVPVIPEPTGKGIVAASLVAAGAAQVLEYDGDEKDLTAVVLDVKLEGGSTTPDIAATTVQAIRGGGRPVDLLAACVLSRDTDVALHYAVGSRILAWTVHVNDQEFLCANSTWKLAVQMQHGSFRLSSKSQGGKDGGARVLLVFAAPAPQLSGVSLPGGVTVSLPAKAAS